MTGGPYAPGWYTPAGAPPTRERYHDGHDWTDQWRDRPSRGLIVAGYVFAVLFALIGFIIGVILMTKNRAGHGIAVCVLSLAVVVGAYSYIDAQEQADLESIYQQYQSRDSDNDGIEDDLDASPYDAAR